jgi:hypothetical protein
MKQLAVIVVAMTLVGCNALRWSQQFPVERFCRARIEYMAAPDDDPQADEDTKNWRKAKYTTEVKNVFVKTCTARLSKAIEPCKDYNAGSDLALECIKRRADPVIQEMLESLVNP